MRRGSYPELHRGLSGEAEKPSVKGAFRLLLEPESWLLTFLPEQHELQHLLQLLHKLPDPGLRVVTQPLGPAGQEHGQCLCRRQGLELPNLLCPALPGCRAAGVWGPGCRDGWHRDHPEVGDYAKPE